MILFVMASNCNYSSQAGSNILSGKPPPLPPPKKILGVVFLKFFFLKKMTALIVKGLLNGNWMVKVNNYSV